MTILLHASPWSRFAGAPGRPLSALGGQELSLLMFPMLTGATDPQFRWNEEITYCRSCAWAPEGNSSDICLPTHGHDHRYGLPGESLGLSLPGLPQRRHREEERKQDAGEDWLFWQYQRYRELAHFVAPENASEASDDDRPPLWEQSLPFGARRDWSSVIRQWKQGDQGQPELSLIVELSRSTWLRAALHSIRQSPRRMLRREHQDQKLSRVQEFDHFTLRELSRRPGRTTAEKAGVRQEIKAVVKRDTTDLPENRVLMWTVLRLITMAENYLYRHKGSGEHDRFHLVKRMHSILRGVARSETLNGVSGLHHHLTTPTYCLQFDQRYKHIWSAYVQVRRQEWALDDAWRWQSSMWASSARLILGSLLLDSEGWEEPLSSTPYFRREGARGVWTTGHAYPGPLRSPLGSCDVHDLRYPLMDQIREHSSVPREAWDSGADWLLSFPKEKRLVLMWSFLQTEAARELSNLHDLNGLESRLADLSQKSDWEWQAILMGSAARPAQETHRTRRLPRTLILECGPELPAHWDSLKRTLYSLLYESHVS